DRPYAAEARRPLTREWVAASLPRSCRVDRGPAPGVQARDGERAEETAGDAMRELRSQRLRRVNHQGDALRLGMNWTDEDLGKPQILVESSYGMGHPGTFHFRPLIEEVSNGVFEAGGKPGVFYASDIR